MDLSMVVMVKGSTQTRLLDLFQKDSYLDSKLSFIDFNERISLLLQGWIQDNIIVYEVSKGIQLQVGNA